MFGIAAAQSSPPTLFGIAVAQPLGISECAPEEEPTKWHAQPSILQSPSFPYREPVGGPCYERLAAKAATNAPLMDEVVFVHFPAATRLQVAIDNTINVLVSDGRVEWIRFATGGLSTQEDDVAALQQKFGPPTKLNHVGVQNGFGAQYQSIQATWQITSDISADLDSAGGGTTERGLATLATSKGRTIMADQFSKVFRGNTPL